MLRQLPVSAWHVAEEEEAGEVTLISLLDSHCQHAEASRLAYNVLRIAGACYLTFLACKMLSRPGGAFVGNADLDPALVVRSATEEDPFQCFVSWATDQLAQSERAGLMSHFCRSFFRPEVTRCDSACCSQYSRLSNALLGSPR
jgi:hypothetical protein